MPDLIAALFGLVIPLGLFMLFALVQGLFLARHVIEPSR